MSDQFFDSLIASDISNMRTIEAVHTEGIHNRAKSLEDNFGIKPQSIESYTKERDPNRFLKTLGWIAAGVAVGMLVAPAAVAMGALWGAVGGLLVGSIIKSHKSREINQGYSDYLDRIAAEGRATKERGPSAGRSAEYDNGSGKPTSFAAEVNASRQQVASKDASR